MKQILPGIWQWSWFSPEKQIDFNGLLLTVGEHRVLVDPPPLTDVERVQLRQGGALDYIVITNRDHDRQAAAYREEFHCQVLMPAVDAPQMEIKTDKTYQDGELLPGGIWALQLQHQKSPGESALYLQQGKGIMIVGDALIGKPPGALSMLPTEKYADREKAREGLRRLLKYNFETILVGDGASILTNAKEAVARALET
jgi:glyoxylase-like metal-dependent hydrolase (beta-lactamase superfamily II)